MLDQYLWKMLLSNVVVRFSHPQGRSQPLTIQKGQIHLTLACVLHLSQTSASAHVKVSEVL